MATPETGLREPVVISLVQPHWLYVGSAADRLLSDLFLKGLVEISIMSDDDDDDDDASSTCQDSEDESSLHSQHRRIELTEEEAERVGKQRFSVLVGIANQHVADIRCLKRHGEYLSNAMYLLDLDCGSNTTWFIGYNCRELRFHPDSSPPFSIHGPLSLKVDRRAKIFDHAYVHQDGYSDPNDSTPRGFVKFGDESGAAILMHDQELRLSMSCFDWTEKMWCGESMVSLDYKPGVACAATKGFYSRPVSGVLALGPMRQQSVFDDAQASAFLEALKPRLPVLPEGGTVAYLAIRPMALYGFTETGYYPLDQNADHWMALNGWPCGLQADWSSPIYLVPEALGSEQHWKVRLLSMTFQRYDADTQKREDLDDLDARTISFGNGGLVVHLDCGTSVSFVPPALVRHIRTKLWPTAKNREIDVKYGDSPCELHSKPQVPFYVPGTECMSIVYTFADGAVSVPQMHPPGRVNLERMRLRDADVSVL